MVGTCEKCERTICAKGLCSRHYIQARRKSLSPLSYVDVIKKSSEWIDRFDAHCVQDGDCILWRGTKTKQGYGMFSVSGVSFLAHRLIGIMAGGDSSCEVFMHSCDNPSCVNPKHLTAGSYKENMQDMHRKGRYVQGSAGNHLKDRSSHPKAKCVSTPFGIFASASLASEHYGISCRSASKWAKQNINGWEYIG